MEELNVQNFKDYVQFLPSVHDAAVHAARRSGYNLVYMRGVATGGDGQATTSQPSVGMYLDEQPITTIQGNLDIHLYDIARVEALAGPQGTLYGASSQAGTIRIITNKPDPSAFASGYSLEGNYVDEDDVRLRRRGLRQHPDGRNRGAPARGLGQARTRAGSTTWNATRDLPGDLADPDDDVIVNNAEFAEDNYNTVDTARRARGAAHRPGRELDGHAERHVPEAGAGRLLGRRPQRLPEAAGKNKVAHFRDEFSTTSGTRPASRSKGRSATSTSCTPATTWTATMDGSTDYSDYSYFYDNLVHDRLLRATCSSTTTATSSIRTPHSERRLLHQDEPRDPHVSTPQDKRVRGLLGFFYQKQYHDFYQEFGLIEGLADCHGMNWD